MKKMLLLTMVFLITFSMCPIMVSRAAPLTYDKNTILCDHDFDFANTLSEEQIQAIFESRNSFLKDYIDPTTGKRASWVIADRAQHYQISSRVLLAKMQQERSAVWLHDKSYEEMTRDLYWDDKYVGKGVDWVLNYGWEISKQYKGFYKQVDNAARSLSEWFADPGSKGWTVGKPHSVEDGTVTPTNKATCALYIYTPYIESNKLLYQVWWMMFGDTGVCIVELALYAGGSNPGLVYRYLGGKVWQPISTEEELDHAYAVLCLTEYEGHLYAGTMSTSYPMGGVGRVYRYDGGTSWTLVGDNLDNQVCSLAVYQGNLYAGTAWNGMKLYRYEGDTTWPQVIDPIVWDGTRSLDVSHGYLLMGDFGWDLIGHWDGSAFHQDQTQMTGSCIYDFEDYGDNVYAAAYIGRMWQSSDGIHWSLVPSFESYYDGNMWELETFQGSLYMAYANGELRASNVPDRGTLKYAAPDGIISMETDGANLYFGTGGEAGAYYGSETEGTANIYRYDGADVTLISDEDEFGAGVQVLYSPPPPPVIESFPEGKGYTCPAYGKPKDGDINGDGRSDWFYEKKIDDQGNSVELWGVDPSWRLLDEYFAVLFGDQTGKYFIGKCPFGGGQNSGFVKHSGDLDGNKKPDSFIEVTWRSEDGGSDDPGSAPGRDAWEYVFNVASKKLKETHYDKDGNILWQVTRTPEKWQSPGCFNDLDPIIVDFIWDDELMEAHPSVDINFDPDTLNLKSEGNFVTIYIEVPIGFDVGEIDVFSIRINGTISAIADPVEIGDYNLNNIADIMVKFMRHDVATLFADLDVPNDYTIWLSGAIPNAGVSFEGADVITVISPP